MWKVFSDLNTRERNIIIRHEILFLMRKLGGKSTKLALRKAIREQSTIISEEVVDERKISAKSGNEYPPFHYPYYYSIRKLIEDGSLVENEKHIELTEKGRTRPLNEHLIMTILEKIRAIDTGTQLPDNNNQIEITEEDKLIIEEEKDPEENWRDQLKTALEQMTPLKFEMFARGLIKAMGITLDDRIGISRSSDGGLDGFGYVRSDDYRTTRVALQAKRWNQKVPSPEIDKFRGAMDKFNAEFGVFITNSEFTREAIQAAREGTRVITLIDGDEICDLVAYYEYYVEPVTTYKLKSFYFEEN